MAAAAGDPALPHDEEAEAAVVVACCTSSKAVGVARAILGQDDFLSPRCARAYGACLALCRDGVEPTPQAVRPFVSDDAWFDGIARDATPYSPLVTTVDHFAARVRDAADRRAGLATAERLSREMRNCIPPRDAFSQAIGTLTFLRGASEPKPKDDGFAWVTSDILMAEEDKPESFLWPEVVALSHTTLFAAFAKAGKSFLTYGMFGALSRGVSWLGFNPLGRTVKTAIVSEEGKSRIRSRCRRFGVLGAEILPIGGAPAGTSWERLVERSAARAKSAGCEALCFDTVSSLAALDGDDENSSSAIITLFRPLRLMAEMHGLAVLAVHHGNKAGGRGGRGIRGSTAFLQSVDEAVEMEVDGGEDSPRRALRFRGRFEPPPKVVVEYHQPDDSPFATYRMLGGADQAEKEKQGRVIAALKPEHGWLTLDDVQGIAEMRRDDVAAALKALVATRAIQGAGLGTKKSPRKYAAVGVPNFDKS